MEQSVEEHAHGEIAEHHHVRNGFHDVPRGVHEGATHDKVELVEKDRATQAQKNARTETGLAITDGFYLVQLDKLSLPGLDEVFQL